MKKVMLTCGLALAAIWMQGCIAIHSEETTVGPTGPDDVVIREIDAVAKLSYQNNRRTAYANIAQRKELSDRVQVHLVAAVFKRLSYENMKADVLLTLIKNPCFSPAAKAAILDRLDRLSYESHRTQVLQAMS